MQAAGMRTHIDDAGNLRGTYSGNGGVARPFLMGSHLDTVRNAGAFDGPLGVVVAIELVDQLASHKLPFDIEIVGFSEEEGVRFGMPFIGSLALTGGLGEDMLAKSDADGVTVAEAIRQFGLDPSKIGDAELQPVPMAYLEFHIEQGPVLDDANESLAIVDSIAGQTRVAVSFTGQANHAGTTPMRLRQDALCGAAEWICAVERAAKGVDGLVATVGKLAVEPGMANAIAGNATLTLDCRHAVDRIRTEAVSNFHLLAREITGRRGLRLDWQEVLDQPATAMNQHLVAALGTAAGACGLSLRRMASGAGHDAMIMAPHMPSVMLFLRSPGGISHHPNETVLLEDVEKALMMGSCFIRGLEAS